MSNVITITELTNRYKNYVTELRRSFHQWPELGFEEQKTTQHIADELDKIGVPYKINPEKNTGIVAWIKGNDNSDAVALRADIDALPVTEENDIDFRSKVPGKMHACGHDSHIAMLLGAARMLMDVKNQINGTVYLIFQPAEEVGTGASYMVRFGDWYKKVSSIYGCHNWISLPAGTIAAKPGEWLAAASQFSVNVHGVSGHGSQPQQTVDASVVACAIGLNLQSIVSRNCDPKDAVVLTIGKMTSGTRWNIISGSAVLEGTCRYFNKGLGKEIEKRMNDIVTHTAMAYGATAELTYNELIPPVFNDPTCTKIGQEAMKKIMGPDGLVEMDKTTGSEDFSYYLEDKPGCFAFVGTNNPKIGAVNPHHSGTFTIDDSILSLGSGVYAQYAIDWLNRK